MNSRSDIVRRFDVVVCGGGLTGLVAAGVLAESGKKVLLTERRGKLGWEITAARRIHLNLDELEKQSPVAGAWLELLRGAQGYRAGLVDPCLAELAFDRWAIGAGVELLFHAWPVRALRCSNGTLCGVEFATRAGYVALGADIIIDAAEYPRIAISAGQGITPKPGSSQLLPLLFLNTSCSEAIEKLPIKLCTGEVVSVDGYPTLWPGECQVDVALPAKEGENVCESSFGDIAESVTQQLRARISGFENAVLGYIDDELWRWPDFSLINSTMAHAGDSMPAAKGYNGVPMADAEDSDPSPGIIAIGSWLLPKAERSMESLVLLGQLAAKMAIQR